MNSNKQLMLVLQKWFLLLLKVFATSVCTEMLNVRTCTAAMAGEYLSDLLFAIDYHCQLLCSSDCLMECG